MTSFMLNCDFSTQFSERFRAALDAAATSKSLVNVFHIINLSVAVNETELSVFSTEARVLKFLREQAQKEFSLLNKRLNTAAVPVTFEVGFSVAEERKTLVPSVL